jgi:amino acid transporter
MIGITRLVLVVVVAQVIAYICLSLYSRSVRRNKLETWWDEKGHTGNKEAFVERGLQKYDNSFRRKLILAVFIVPWVAIAALIYVINFM